MASVKKAVINVVREQVANKIDQGQTAAKKEIAKVKKQFNTTLKSVEGYVKENPEKAALITAGVAAAIGAALAMLMRGKKKGKK